MELNTDTQIIDDFLKQRFKQQTDRFSGTHEEFFEDFTAYFKDNIFGRVPAESVFLHENEKKLQYVTSGMIEATLEYDLLAEEQASHAGKTHYAEKGANHCIVMSVLGSKNQKKFMQDRARQFYRKAFIHSDGVLNMNMFRFLGLMTPEISSGLEQLLADLRIDDFENDNLMENPEAYAKKHGLIMLEGNYLNKSNILY